MPELATVVLECYFSPQSGLACIERAGHIGRLRQISRDTLRSVPRIDIPEFLADYLTSVHTPSYTYVAIVPRACVSGDEMPTVYFQVVQYITDTHTTPPVTAPVDTTLPPPAYEPATTSRETLELHLAISNTKRADRTKVKLFAHVTWMPTTLSPSNTITSQLWIVKTSSIASSANAPLACPIHKVHIKSLFIFPIMSLAATSSLELVTVVLECTVLPSSGLVRIVRACTIDGIPSRITRDTLLTSSRSITIPLFLGDYLDSVATPSYTYVAVIQGEYSPSPRNPEPPVFFQVVQYIKTTRADPRITGRRTADPRIPEPVPVPDSLHTFEQHIERANANRATHRPITHFRPRVSDTLADNYTAIDQHHVPRLDAPDALTRIFCQCTICASHTAAE